MKNGFTDCVNMSLSLFFVYCRKSVIRARSTEDDVHLVHRELDVGKQTKSVQVEPLYRY